jgi:hypothetical protein
MHLPPVTPPAPHPKRRRIIIAAAVAGVVVLIVVISEASGSQKHPSPSATATPAAAASSVPATAAALSPGGREFVAAIRAALSARGDSNPATDAMLAQLASHICATRTEGGSQSAVIAASEAAGVQTKLDMQPRAMVLAAERDTCPGEIPVRQTITYIVTGTPGAQVTYGPAGTNLTGSVPMDVTKRLGDPSYYAMNAQLQGGGRGQCCVGRSRRAGD